MPKAKENTTFVPFVSAVRNFRDFHKVRQHLKNAGFKGVKQIEVGRGYSRFWSRTKHDRKGYHAIFYQGPVPRELLLKWRKRFNPEYEINHG